ncbi:cytochrome P450 [Pseudonocardia adelaidensis]|uniref:cytochrome P450 n=1 Tax=Pseudonocardia adelaidensis TaxID=648754 RepID=UPI0031ECC887
MVATRASVGDTLRTVGTALAPVAARGVIVRRPWVMAAAERMDADHRLVRTLQRLRARYGPAPLRLRVPGRSVVLVLDAADVDDVLARSPEPFATATPEKRGALAHFQPGNVLISHGADRADRRRFTESVLEPERPLHHLAEPMVGVVRQEAADLLGHHGLLDWDTLATTWMRIVRRVVLGDSARDDAELTELLARLRGAANWSLAHPGRPRLRAEFLDRLRERLATADPGSLGAVVTETPVTARTRPVEQVPQWLFAFDPAGIATFRALALLATHPAELDAARSELAGHGPDAPRDLPGLRAAVLESVRLWPTTPAILRETTTPTELGGRTLPARTLVVVLTPFFHRDDQRLPDADRFAPQLWRDGGPPTGLVPFSAGPAICPGRSVVQFVASTFLAAVLEHHDVRLDAGPPLGPERPLPGTLDPYRLRFTVTRR